MENLSHKENTPSTNPESSTTSAPGQKGNFPKKRTHRFLSVLRRVGNEWNCLVHKIRLAPATYSEGEALDSLFDTSDDDFFERIPRLKKCCNNSTEARFLEDFKKYKLLEEYSKNNPTHSSEGAASSMESPHTPLYQSLDVQRLRQQCDGELNPVSLPVSTHDLQLTTQEATLKDRMMSRDGNLGTALWEIRRARWLIPDECEDVEEKVAQRVAGLSVKHISPEMYPQIYRDFVEKARPLKAGKRINLEDMVVVIHSGWVSDKVWDPANKSLG